MEVQKIPEVEKNLLLEFVAFLWIFGTLRDHSQKVRSQHKRYSFSGEAQFLYVAGKGISPKESFSLST